MNTGSTNRSELARFLRSRRERLDPAHAGFPTSARRRSRGLRREEVAVLAGLSPTWYAYLEQGRDIHPSPEVLDSLARALLLTEDERRYVHTLAFGQVIRPAPLPGEPAADELARRLVALAGDSAYPVYAVDQRGDLLAWNSAAAEWYDDWDLLPAGDRNIVHWFLVCPCARTRLVGWERAARDLVAWWRAESAHWPDDEALRRRVGRLAALSDRFARWWDERDVLALRSRVRVFRHPQGVRALLVAPVRPAEFSPIRIVYHLPVGPSDPVAGRTDPENAPTDAHRDC
ncbi:helix-turn-helix transcriptional regulator [Actinosynnema sp. CS-041913]|uniref:helix-turn-helix transcriptional regulator n=1 Tax=Actinosynnema sp. CS-041913 TaxID=3239917 RepID=UPI003D93469A